MTAEKEGFVHRWARRAHHARHEPAPEPVDPPAATVAEPEPEGEAPELPPLESLDAESDYTAFLGANVPKVVRAAALRKAWTSDPTIAAHRPLVEYDWDCNAPGYGQLKPNDLTGKLARNLMRHFVPKEDPSPDPPAEVEVAGPPEHPAPVADAKVEQIPVEEPSPAAVADHAPGPEESSGIEMSSGGDDPLGRRHGSARPS